MKHLRVLTIFSLFYEKYPVILLHNQMRTELYRKNVENLSGGKKNGIDGMEDNEGAVKDGSNYLSDGWYDPFQVYAR